MKDYEIEIRLTLTVSARTDDSAYKKAFNAIKKAHGKAVALEADYLNTEEEA